MTETPAEPLSAIREALERLLRGRARGGEGWGFNADMHEEAVVGAILADPAFLDALRAATRESAGAVIHDEWCDGSGSSAGSACCRTAAENAGLATGLDMERSVIPHSLVEQVIDATIGLRSRESAGLDIMALLSRIEAKAARRIALAVIGRQPAGTHERNTALTLVSLIDALVDSVRNERTGAVVIAARLPEGDPR